MELEAGAENVATKSISFTIQPKKMNYIILYPLNEKVWLQVFRLKVKILKHIQIFHYDCGGIITN